MIATVIIPTYNRRLLVLDTLRALERQTLSDSEMEVIVVDDGSTDGTRTEVERYLRDCRRTTWRFLVHKENRGKAAALNTAIQVTRSPFVLLSDDDCRPAKDWAEMHLRRHAESSAPIGVLGAVTFPQEWLARSNFVRYYNSRYVGNRSPKICGDLANLPPNLFGGLNASIPRELLERIGMYNTKVQRGQDIEMAYRLHQAGCRLVFDARPLVVHYSPEMHSLSLFMSKFVKTYSDFVPLLQQLHPEYIERYGHWFLERPAFGCESLGRSITKCMVRLCCLDWLAQPLLRYLERTDGDPKRYAPLLYQYVFATFCVQTVKKRDGILQQGMSKA